MHIGEKIKKIRQLRSLTQESLGSKINLTRSAKSFIEQNGKVNHQTFLNILKALNISEDYLLNFDHKSIMMHETITNSDRYKTENELLKSKVDTLSNEISSLKALVKSQQKLISMLEKLKK